MSAAATRNCWTAPVPSPMTSSPSSRMGKFCMIAAAPTTPAPHPVSSSPMTTPTRPPESVLLPANGVGDEQPAQPVMLVPMPASDALLIICTTSTGASVGTILSACAAERLRGGQQERVPADDAGDASLGLDLRHPTSGVAFPC